MSFVTTEQYVGAPRVSAARLGGVVGGYPVTTNTASYVTGAPYAGGYAGAPYGTNVIGGHLATGAVSGSYVTGGSTRMIGGPTTVVGGLGTGLAATTMGGYGGYGGLAASGLVSPAPIYNKAVVEEIPTESRIEYVPYEKREIIYEQIERVEQIPVQRVITEYEEIVRTERVPVQRVIQDYYAVEYQVEYIPNTIQETIVEYVPQEHITERVQYVPIETQIIHYPEAELAQSGAYVAGGATRVVNGGVVGTSVGGVYGAPHIGTSMGGVRTSQYATQYATQNVNPTTTYVTETVETVPAGNTYYTETVPNTTTTYVTETMPGASYGLGGAYGGAYGNAYGGAYGGSLATRSVAAGSLGGSYTVAGPGNNYATGVSPINYVSGGAPYTQTTTTTNYVGGNQGYAMV